MPPLWSGERRLQFLRLTGYGILQAMAAVIAALLVRAGFDRIADPAAAGSLSVLIGGLALAAATVAGLRFLETVESERLGQGYVHELRTRLFAHLLELGPEARLPCGRGALLVRFSGDLTALRQWLARGLARLLVSGIAALGAIGTLLLLEPALGAVLLLAILTVAAPGFLLGRTLRRSARRLRRERGRLASLLADRLGAMATVLAFARTERERRAVARISDRLRERAIARARAAGALRALGEGGAVAGMAVVLGIGAWQIGIGATSPGGVVGALVIVGIFTPRLRELGRVWEYWNNATVAREKIEHLFACEPRTRRRTRRLPAGPGRLTLERLRYGRRIRGVTATVEPGARIALLGANGAGKTTLLMLMGGILVPDRGRVRLDGVDIARLRPSARRRALAFAGGGFPLLRGSLRDNLLYGSGRIAETELAEVVERTGLAELVARLRRGLDTPLAEAGGDLSAGERMRVMLARAWLAKPRLLFLDEPETALDAAALRTLERLFVEFPGSILFATHSPRLARLADTAWRLETGRLAAIDSPATLLDGERAAPLPRPLEAVS